MKSSSKDGYQFEYLPGEFWDTEECKTASTKIKWHCHYLVRGDAEVLKFAGLDRVLRRGYFYDALRVSNVMTDERRLKSSFERAAYVLAGEYLEDCDDDDIRRPALWQLNEFVQTLVDLVDNYVPRVAEWSRENIKEIPESLDTTAVWELVYHAFIDMLPDFGRPAPEQPAIEEPAAEQPTA